MISRFLSFLVRLELKFKFLFFKEDYIFMHDYINELYQKYKLNNIKTISDYCVEYFKTKFKYRYDPLWGMIDTQDNFKKIVSTNSGDCDEGSWFVLQLMSVILGMIEPISFEAYQLNYFTLTRPSISHSVVAVRLYNLWYICDWGLSTTSIDSDLEKVLLEHVKNNYGYKGIIGYGLVDKFGKVKSLKGV